MVAASTLAGCASAPPNEPTREAPPLRDDPQPTIDKGAFGLFVHGGSDALPGSPPSGYTGRGEIFQRLDKTVPLPSRAPLATLTIGTDGFYEAKLAPGDYWVCADSTCAPFTVASAPVRIDYCVCMAEGWTVDGVQIPYYAHQRKP